MLLDALVSFLLQRRLELRKFKTDVRTSNRHFSEPSLWPLLTSDGLVISNFRERLKTLRTGLWDWLILRMRFHQMRIPGCGCKRFFELSAVLASEVGYTGKTNHERLASNTLICPVPSKLPMDFTWAMLFRQDVTDQCTLARSADYPLFVCRDHTPLQTADLHVHDLSLASGCADVLGYEVSPVNACCNQRVLQWNE